MQPCKPRYIPEENGCVPNCTLLEGACPFGTWGRMGWDCLGNNPVFHSGMVLGGGLEAAETLRPAGQGRQLNQIHGRARELAAL